MNANKVGENLFVPVASGIIAYVGAKMVAGGTGEIALPLLGPVQGEIAIGLVTAASSFGSKFVRNAILPILPPMVAQYGQKGSDFLTPLINGGLVYAMFKGDLPLTTSMLIGGGSQIGADWAYSKYSA